MKMPKPSDEVRERFIELGSAQPDSVVRPMFGQLGAFVNGNMYAGLFGEQVGVKLSPDDLEELRAAGGTPFGPEERPMGGFLTIPESADAAEWFARAHAHISTLPPKRK
jgi:TfoX/Sxy family transcriptional regulator of competence genes